MSENPDRDGVGVGDDKITARDQDPIGTRDVSPEERDPDADVPPEQAAGGVEVRPDPPIPPKSGFHSADPRHDEKPYDSRPRT